MRFVEYDGVLYALKELPERPARREWTLLRRLEGQELPVVEAVGIVTERGEDLDAILITRHLEYSLPYRALFSGAAIPDLRTHLLNALAELLARLHIRGFFWGDCSLSNALFRRDAGALSAYLVDAETGELHGQLSDGQRAYDLDIAQTNIVGELLDVDAEVGLPPDLDPDETGEEIVQRYTSLWHELTREETFGPDERFKLDERLHPLNDLGFDVEEIQLEATPSGYRLRLDPHVVEPGHHRHRLLRLTGLDAQENQARRMLNDIARFREALERREKRTIPSRSPRLAGGRRCSSRRSLPFPRSSGRRCRRPRSSTRCSSTAGSCRSSAARTSGSTRRCAPTSSASCRRGRPSASSSTSRSRTRVEREAACLPLKVPSCVITRRASACDARRRTSCGRSSRSAERPSGAEAPSA